MDIELDSRTGLQKYLGRKTLSTPDLVYVLVALALPDSVYHDRFFILTMADLQDCCVRHYKNDMDKRGWRRPKNPASFHISYDTEKIAEFENNWAIVDRLQRKS